MKANEVQVEACARAAHEANRAYCIAIGDTSQLSVLGIVLIVYAMIAVAAKWWPFDKK